MNTNELKETFNHYQNSVETLKEGLTKAEEQIKELEREHSQAVYKAQTYREDLRFESGKLSLAEYLYEKALKAGEN